MDIITKEEQKGRLEDGIETLLHLDEESFNFVLEQLQSKEEYLKNLEFYYTTDGCEAPDNEIQLGLERIWDNTGKRISRAYFGGDKYSMRQVLETLQLQLDSFAPDSPEYTRIKKLLDARGLESFKSRYLVEDGSNAHVLDMVFEILSSQDTFEKFVDFENNSQYFSKDGKNTSKGEYLKYLGKFFGNKDKEGNLKSDNTISKDFYIPDLEEHKKRYSQLFDEVNMDRYVNLDYEFKSNPNYVLRKGEEPEWTISSEIYKEVYSGMRQDLTLEEQAMWIYCKLCQMFQYDEGYLYRDKLSKVNYESTFSKEHLENLVPGSKVTCYDFSRIFAKLVNEIEGDIEAVVVIEGINEGHFKAGFYTDRVSAELEPVNINVNGSNDPTNDMMKAKNGIKLKGIKPISDREDILEKAMDTVYPAVLGKQPVSIKEFKQQLKQIPREDIPNDVGTKLESFIEVMKTNSILGNEFAQTLAGLRRAKFFGEGLDCAYLGNLEEQENGQKKYKRKILLRQKATDSKDGQETRMPLYLIDSDSLDLSVCSDEYIISKLNSGEFIYESEDRKMPGIDKEVE